MYYQQNSLTGQMMSPLMLAARGQHCPYLVLHWFWSQDRKIFVNTDGGISTDDKNEGLLELTTPEKELGNGPEIQ